jgi:transcriptional regulator with XRE-family HTH domain
MVWVVTRSLKPANDEPVTVALRRLMDEHGASLRWVATKARELDEAGKGVNHTYISAVLTGREIPSPRSLGLLARVFDVDPEYFVEYRMGKMRAAINPRIVGFDAAFRAFTELEAAGR